MISVRPFDEKHAPALAEMMREMVRSYGAELPAGLNVEEELIGHARRIDMVVAFNQETLAGFATFTTLFPVRGLLAFTYIQQIYVGSTARRLGVAQRLMAAIAQAARARGSNGRQASITPLRAPFMTVSAPSARPRSSMFSRAKRSTGWPPSEAWR